MGAATGKAFTFNSIVQMLLLLGVDYLAVVSAEGVAYSLRNWLVHTGVLRVSWLNFWVVFPAIFLFFINMLQLYSRRRPFYKEVEQLFHACCYGALGIILVLYVAQIASSTSRLFVGLVPILAFVFFDTAALYAEEAFASLSVVFAASDYHWRWQDGGAFGALAGAGCGDGL